MKTITKEQRRYLESFLGKYWWLRDNGSDLKSGEGVIAEIVEILHTGTYDYSFSEWLNSLDEIYEMLKNTERSTLNKKGINYTLQYLKEKDIT